MIERLLQRVAAALDQRALPYMIIGGQAVLLYGEPRLTKDIDITLGAGLERLPDALAAAHAAGLDPLVDPESFTRETLVLPCADQESGMRVDLIFSFSPFEQLALSRARTVKIGDASLRFASVEDLIIHKIIAGRARDIEDVKSILVKNPAADQLYMRKWLRDFSAATGEPYEERLDEVLATIG